MSADADLIATDFVATGSAGMSKAAAQVASVISMVSAAGGTDASAAVMAEVATKISAAGEAGGKSSRDVPSFDPKLPLTVRMAFLNGQKVASGTLPFRAMIPTEDWVLLLCQFPRGKDQAVYSRRDEGIDHIAWRESKALSFTNH